MPFTRSKMAMGTMGALIFSYHIPANRKEDKSEDTLGMDTLLPIARAEFSYMIDPFIHGPTTQPVLAYLR